MIIIWANAYRHDSILHFVFILFTACLRAMKDVDGVLSVLCLVGPDVPNNWHDCVPGGQSVERYL